MTTVTEWEDNGIRFRIVATGGDPCQRRLEYFVVEPFRTPIDGLDGWTRYSDATPCLIDRLCALAFAQQSKQATFCPPKRCEKCGQEISE